MTDLTEHHFGTPNGRHVGVLCRPGTSDHLVAQSICGEDEYGFKGRSWSGWALDVGSHIGVAALALAIDNPDLQVIALEAVPANADLIRANVIHNKLGDRIRVVNAAIAPEDGEATVWSEYTSAEGLDDDYVHTNRFIGNVIRLDWHGWWNGLEQTVPGVTLTSLLEGIVRVAVTKTDCEGGEWALFGDPAITRLDEIVGEYHDRSENDLFSALAATHEVTTHPAGEAIGLFRAVRR